jgi:small nuclear ribonucleoprotein (snRNP)-like protein
LFKKYGTNIRLLLAKSVEEKKDVDNAASPDLRKEEWYQLNENQMGSGEMNALSAIFDPVAVLTAPCDDVYTSNPWMKESGILLDNIDKFATHLPLDDPQHRDTRAKRGIDEVKRKVRPSETKRPKTIHPFDAIASRLDSGPISVLYKLRQKRVTVVVRYVNAIRGSLTGTLIAFDKHMNMILKDVVEEYSPRPVGHDGKDKSNLEVELERRVHTDLIMRKSKDTKVHGDMLLSTGTTLNVQRREMRQLLVRGDMVVSAYAAPTEYAKTNKDVQTEHGERSSLTGKPISR